MDKIRASVIGAGRWGPNILGALSQLPQVELAHMCDLNKEALARIKDKYSSVEITTSIDDLLKEELDLICIATPVTTHFKLAKLALEAGKNVFVEKPLCGTSAECDELVRIAARVNRKIMVGHVFLFNPTIIKHSPFSFQKSTPFTLIYRPYLQPSNN